MRGSEAILGHNIRDEEPGGTDKGVGGYAGVDDLTLPSLVDHAQEEDCEGQFEDDCCHNVQPKDRHHVLASVLAERIARCGKGISTMTRRDPASPSVPSVISVTDIVTIIAHVTVNKT